MLRPALGACVKLAIIVGANVVFIGAVGAWVVTLLSPALGACVAFSARFGAAVSFATLEGARVIALGA